MGKFGLSSFKQDFSSFLLEEKIRQWIILPPLQENSGENGLHHLDRLYEAFQVPFSPGFQEGPILSHCPVVVENLVAQCHLPSLGPEA